MVHCSETTAIRFRRNDFKLIREIVKKEGKHFLMDMCRLRRYELAFYNTIRNDPCITITEVDKLRQPLSCIVTCRKISYTNLIDRRIENNIYRI